MAELKPDRRQVFDLMDQIEARGCYGRFEVEMNPHETRITGGPGIRVARGQGLDKQRCE